LRTLKTSPNYNIRHHELNSPLLQYRRPFRLHTFLLYGTRTKQKATTSKSTAPISSCPPPARKIDLATTVSEEGLTKGAILWVNGRRRSRYAAFSLYLRHCPSPSAKLLPKGRYDSVGGGVYDVGRGRSLGWVCAL